MASDTMNISCDALIAMLITEAEVRDLAALPSLEEMDAKFHPSTRFTKKMDTVFASLRKKEQKEKGILIVRRATAFIITCCSLFFFALLPAAAVRQSIVSTVLIWRESFVDFIYGNDDSSITLPEKIELSYTPEGFFLAEPVSFDSDRYFAIYQNAGNDLLTVRILSIQKNQSLALDDEYSEFYSLEFDGNNAIWAIPSDGTNVLTWENNSILYKISGAVNVVELIKVGQGITF